MRPLPSTSPIFETYWRFAAERHAIYERRLCGLPAPWTNDEILNAYRFTNAFRSADRVSQYLIRYVIGSDGRSAEETVLRILVFKIFNKIETWELLCDRFGDVSLATFDPTAFGKVLSEARQQKRSVYSNAYIVPPVPGTEGAKHDGHLRLFANLLDGGFASAVQSSENLADLFHLIHRVPGFGNFLGYQLAIDVNYSAITSHEESEFVTPGPGALDGISKVFPGIDLRQATHIIKQLTDEQESWFAAFDLDPVTLFGRRLQPIDIQNLFCEVSKYSRVSHPDQPGVSGRTRIKQTYKAQGLLESPVFPAKWSLNVPDMTVNTSFASHVDHPTLALA